VLTALFLLCVAVRPAGGADPPPAADGAKFFEAQVLPILRSNCAACHGGEKVRGGLNLSTRDGLLKGGDRGPAVLLDKPPESRLLLAVGQQGELKMPPKGKLPQAQIDTLTRWVAMGAPWSGAVAAPEKHGPPPVDERARSFWSFRPVVRPPVPEVCDPQAPNRNPIDAFVQAKLRAAGLAPAPPAGKTSLLRRVTYDLIGLPPTPEEADAFLADESPDAYERVVDRLLGSPHYGEKWGRHWLDLVRYAETNGYEVDPVKPNAWRYRDYVIRSFNDDKPYDQFIREQLAGDELSPVTADGIIATGYYKLAPMDGGAPDRLQAQYDELDDVVATTGQVFLGLTVNCARCHDHKSDPFPQADYYRLLAFFHNVRSGMRGAQRTIGDQPDAEAQKVEITLHQEEVAGLERNIKQFEDALRPLLTEQEADDFKTPEYRVDIARRNVPGKVAQQDFEYYRDRVRRLAEIRDRQPPALARALAVTENGRTPPDTFVLTRGNPRAKGVQVEAGFPAVLGDRAPTFPPANPGAMTTGRRRVLADWIASPDNPLTARVMVNRIWQHHFGRGIVRSASDFGFRGTPPTHPELLDWLASEFVAGGWRLKPLHRLIVTSSTYRQSSTIADSRGSFSNPQSAIRNPQSIDPENDLFWRFDLRRLTAEEVRDSVLAVSGNLNRTKIGGPSVYPKISAEVFAGQSRPGSGWPTSSPEDQARRGVYVHVKRSLALPLHAAFDAPYPDGSCPVRFTTTVPTQALAMLNGEFLNEQAGVFAETVRRRAGDDPAVQVRLALRRATQREPTAAEVARGAAFLARLRSAHQLSPDEALGQLCLLALNLNEFMFLD
jgi:mono/diheme cytochrome c family protein